MTKILISGGAGFVGSHLVNELVNRGHDVMVLDDLSAGCKQNINPKAVFWQADITKINNPTIFNKFDVIFHLAAKPFSKSKHDWFSESHSIVQTNTFGTYNLLRLMKPETHFIAISSASVYGEGHKFFETNPYNPISAYGYSKTTMEHLILQSPRKNVTIVRPGTIIGTNGRCFPNRLIWSAIHGMLTTIFKNGTAVRDTIDARDVAKALSLIMDTKSYGIFNLGAENELSGTELVAAFKPIAETHNIPFIAHFLTESPSDFVVHSSLCSHKIQQALNWKPEHSLTDSLETITDHYLHSEFTREPPSWESI